MIENTSVNEINFFIKGDIEDSIKRIEKILNTGIFTPQNIGNVFVKSAFIETLICLRDLMAKCEKFASRISFNDDVFITEKVNDVTDLIKYIRDALCHLDSNNHFLPDTNIKATYNVLFGQGVGISIDGVNIASSNYDDDVCFCFGEQKIYLERHIIRSFKEAKSKLLPLIS